MIPADMNLFPSAEEARGGYLTLGNAIFEMELQTCYVSILDAIRNGKKIARVGVTCAKMIISFLQEKGYKVEVIALTAAESRMRKYRNQTCIEISWE